MIIVTGAAGMIGSNAVRALNERGYADILAVDRLERDERWKNLRGLRFRDYLQADRFLAAMTSGENLGRVEAVLHFGACSDTAERDVDFLVRNNFEYSKAVAGFALQQGARLLHASSAATYGDGAQGYLDDESRLDALRPLNPYGWSKHLFDLWARDTGVLGRIVSLKFFNVFGPNEYHKGDMRSVVCRAFEQVRAGGPMRLFRSGRPEYADGAQQRDFLYVKDAVRMTLHLLGTPYCGIFNIGSGVARTWNDLAAALFSALEQPPNVEFIDMPEALRDRYQYHTCAEMGRFNATGFVGRPNTLEEAVDDYVRNYLVPGKHLDGTPR